MQRRSRSWPASRCPTSDRETHRLDAWATRGEAGGRPWPGIAVWVGALLLLTGSARASVPELLEQLYLQNQTDYARVQGERYARFCRIHDLDDADPDNHRTYLIIHFLHDLLTGNGAADGLRGGWLQIPYFWHWIDPNPRHGILALPDSTPLREMPPPSPYERYQSRADIDRLPALYLCDLVSDAPRYTHPLCGSFHTFGWCSEREMAFVVLLRALGYEGKVWQARIHVCSKIWCPMQRRDGHTTVLEAEVDNTFNQIYWDELSLDVSFPEWVQEIGSGTEIDWYNRVARSDEQLERVRACDVTDAARARLAEQVRAGVLQAREQLQNGR